MGFWRLLPTALGIGVPTMMQVGPDDAILNLCKWPRKIARGLPENCLPGVSADQMYLAAVILVCLGLLWFGWPYLRGAERQARMVSGILILCCAIAIGVFGLSIIAAGDRSPKTSIILDETFYVDPDIYREAHSIRSPDGRETNLYENTFYLVVANSLGDGKTLRKVQVEYRGYEAPFAAEIKDSTANEIDIKHGNGAFFVIGRIVSSNNLGMFKGSVTIDDKSIEAFEQRDAMDVLSFNVGTSENKNRFALGSPPSPPTGWILMAVISAEDKKSRVVKLNIDARDKTNPVTFAKGEVVNEQR